MYICPTCGKQFENDEVLIKHFLKCWKEKNPNHKSKPAPRSADIDTREDNQEILDFFKPMHLYGVGRWGEHQHHNHDVCMKHAIDFVATL